MRLVLKKTAPDVIGSRCQVVRGLGCRFEGPAGPLETGNGAVTGTKVEPESLAKVFDELKDWEVCLRSDPVLVQKLLSLEETKPDPTKSKETRQRPALRRGPSL